MIIYAKNYTGKILNEVPFCVDFCIRSLLSKIAKLFMFQTIVFLKIKTALSYLYAVANIRLDKIHASHPLPSHNRISCDRDFA